MKITKAENGYLLEDPQTSNESQALEEFIERVRGGNKLVSCGGPEVPVTLKAGGNPLSIRTDEQLFEDESQQIKRFVEFYQSQGLVKHKALELALKSVGIYCELGMHDMQRD